MPPHFPVFIHFLVSRSVAWVSELIICAGLCMLPSFSHSSFTPRVTHHLYPLSHVLANRITFQLLVYLFVFLSLPLLRIVCACTSKETFTFTFLFYLFKGRFLSTFNFFFYICTIFSFGLVSSCLSLSPTCFSLLLFSFHLRSLFFSLLSPLFPPPLLSLSQMLWVAGMGLLPWLFLIKSQCFFHLPINHGCFCYLVLVCGLLLLAFTVCASLSVSLAQLYSSPHTASVHPPSPLSLSPSLFMPLTLSFALHLSPLFSLPPYLHTHTPTYCMHTHMHICIHFDPPYHSFFSHSPPPTRSYSFGP